MRNTDADPLAALPPDHPVNRQLAAYNAHDLDGFIACFHPTCRLMSADGTVRAEGPEQLHAAYIPVFAISGRHAVILDRIVLGDWVVDHEEISNEAGERFEALVTYRLADGEIVEMRMH
ncbi:MAG: nuclear transport factor 2 family protein [Actinobacteria bacterium]|nr:nuclear transport factor 2 family protein [Actinomycetota bacterium]